MFMWVELCVIQPAFMCLSPACETVTRNPVTENTEAQSASLSLEQIQLSLVLGLWGLEGLTPKSEILRTSCWWCLAGG